MKRTSIRLFTLAALSTACLAASLFGTVQAAPAPNAANAILPVVAVQAVEMLPQTVSRRLAGRVTALHTVNITARVSGEIKEVAFADGALVKKGDVLYRLDDVQYQAALQSAKAAVMQAQAEALYAERDYKRQQALYEQKASSRDVLDAAERTAKTSAAALASAKAALITAEDNLKHCVIAAPMDGRMSFTNYSAGNYVTAAGSATTTLATLVSVSPVRVRAALSMKDIAGLYGSIAELQKSAAVQAELSDGSDLSEIGRITAVDNAADEKTDTLYAAAEFKDPLGRLVPGSTVTITITLSKPDSLFPAVQPSALQHDAEGAYVWVVNAPQDGAAQTQKRRVEVGRAVNGQQLITAGLQKDDVVVVEGMQKAGEGKTVKVQQAAAPSAGAAAEQPSN